VLCFSSTCLQQLQLSTLARVLQQWQFRTSQALSSQRALRLAAEHHTTRQFHHKLQQWRRWVQGDVTSLIPSRRAVKAASVERAPAAAQWRTCTLQRAGLTALKDWVSRQRWQTLAEKAARRCFKNARVRCCWRRWQWLWEVRMSEKKRLRAADNIANGRYAG